MNWSHIDDLPLPEQVEHLKYLVEELVTPPEDGPDLSVLTVTQRRIVSRLLRANGRIVPLDALITALSMGSSFQQDKRTVQVHISHIRARLRAAGSPIVINTIWGVGYSAVIE